METEGTSIISVVLDNFLISRSGPGKTQMIVTDSFVLSLFIVTSGYFWVRRLFKKKTG
jgi:hypothetical protein